jgi:hypothetical protein
MNPVSPWYKNCKRTQQKRKLQANFLAEHRYEKFSIKYYKLPGTSGSHP